MPRFRAKVYAVKVIAESFHAEAEEEILARLRALEERLTAAKEGKA